MEETPASELFHEFHHDPPETLCESTFQELYEEVAVTDTQDLEQIYKEWNHGSGYESTEFRGLRYCMECQTYVEGSDEAINHATQNHGYDAFLYKTEPDYVREERSMSVGDIVKRDETYHGCAPVGWQEIEILEGETR